MCNNILKHPSVDDYTKTKEFNVFFPNLNFDRLEAIDWKNKKITAAKETIKELLKEKGNVNNKTDDNDYDSEEIGYDIFNGDEYVEKKVKSYFEYFFENIPNNVIFHVGFDVLIGEHEECCYCPCNINQVKWRNQFLNEGKQDSMAEMPAPDRCTNGRQMNPNGLMDHLDKIGKQEDAVLHRGLAIYLRKLYANYWKVGLDHKGLYKKQDANWMAAVAAEQGNKNQEKS